MPAELPLTGDDRRVLEAVVQYLRQSRSAPSVREVAEIIGMDERKVRWILRRLREADPPYIDLSRARGRRHYEITVTERGHGEIGQGPRPIRVFCSYSHKDAKLRERLEIHLTALNRQGLIDEWHDRRITAGREWKSEIDDNLEAAEVILLLVSPDFLASEYAYNKELRRALDRHWAGEARVVPIILRYSDWQETPIGDLQALPPDGRPVAGRGDRAWDEVAKGLRRVITEIRKAH